MTTPKNLSKPRTKTMLIFCCTIFLTNTVYSATSSISYMDQGWDKTLREKFYFVSQGSQLIPYQWFLALEQPGSTDLFSSPANLKSFGWIYESQPSKLNPDYLPIGFTNTPNQADPTAPWLGLNCAACHTNDITYKDQLMRIDGAPSMADVDAFVHGLSQTVTANHPAMDQQKFARFAGRVLGSTADKESIEKLGEKYAVWAMQYQGLTARLTPPVAAGPGRVDALTQIVNALSVEDLNEPDNYHPMYAPVSYPFLWYTPKLDWVQWNPFVSNPIARNAGEALGVFSPAALHGDPTFLFESTVLFENLYHMEKWIDELKPPSWDEKVFGKLNISRGKKGKELFMKDCRSCHNMPPFRMTDPRDNIVGKQFIKITRVNYKAVGTDPVYVENLLTRFSKTGPLASVLFGNQPVVPALAFNSESIGAVVKAGMNKMGLSPKEQLEYSDYRFYPPASPGAAPKAYVAPSFDDLKAGPLLGIWSTGPFLHNGSVPNVYELLSPPEKRSKVFWVGSRELDTKNLGFVSTEREGLFRYDTSIPGNTNTGHNFVTYSRSERLAVIEFLKDPVRFLDMKE